MSINNKNNILKRLYTLKAIGYKFVDIDLIKSGYMGDFSNLNTLNNQIKQCALCKSKQICNNTIIGRGYNKSKIIFVGLEPTQDEDKNGKFLTGNFGEKLCKVIEEATGLNQDEFYYTSILKCKKFINEDLNLNVKNCTPYLFEEINLIKPKFIITLGEDTFLYLYLNFSKENTFERVRGSFIKIGKNMALLPTYSFDKITKNPSLEKIFYQDLKKLKEYI